MNELIQIRPYSQIFYFNLKKESAKNSKRHKLEIYYDILNTLYTEERAFELLVGGTLFFAINIIVLPISGILNRLIFKH